MDLVEAKFANLCVRTDGHAPWGLEPPREHVIRPQP